MATDLAAQAPPYSNLHVLPSDISRQDLGEAMLLNLQGLGLRRRQNEGCLHCHVGTMEQPVDTWDFASDDKPAKRKARVMMAMVRAINGGFLNSLDDRLTPPIEVTCYTCHAGRTDPRTLTDLLAAAYEAGGIDSAITRFRQLRARYYEADAYDFRVRTLAGMADALARAEVYDDAIALARVNLEFHPEDHQARTNVRRLTLLQTEANDGLDAALAQYDRMRAEHPDEVDVLLLDDLGWWLSRQGQGDEAFVVFRKNLATFPDEYIPNESLGDALYFNADDLTGAIAVFEAWLERHPDHAMARRRLTNLKAEE
jgi:tetratricopeptide (TPR) repeat protein